MVMIEISGKERKIESFIELMRPFGIIEMVRTGSVAMTPSPITGAAGNRE